MREKTSPNRKTARMITKNLIILVVLVIVVILAMWAWFTQNTSATAEGIDVECKAPKGIQIAVVAPGETPKESDYKSGTITLKDQTFLKKLVLSEVTSDGFDFYKPVLYQTNGVAYPDLTADWDTAVANDSYLSFDLYIRSGSPNTVLLSEGSKFTTVSSTLTGDSCENKSPYGSFSRDAVVGATRFSVVDNSATGTDKLKLLWIPRPDVYLSNVDGNYSVSTNVTSSDYDGETYEHKYYTITETGKTLTTMDSDLVTTSAANTDGEYVLPANKEIAKLTKSNPTDEYYTKCVNCNMWIDGEDSESKLALVKGRFKISLDLTIQ